MFGGFAKYCRQTSRDSLTEVIMRWVSVVVLLSCVRLAPAQTASSVSNSQQPPPAEELSPQAAYDQAARPLDIVRRAAQNWSDVELAALDVAQGQAKVACHARSPSQFTGEDLLAYARLCAFAQEWPPVQQAGTNYLVAYNAATPADKLTGFPRLSMAFDYVVQASLHLKNSTNAFGTAYTMLHTVPYDDLASDAVNSTVRYVQLVHTDQALVLLKERQSLLLALLKARATPATQPSAPTPAARPPMSIHDLYADAIQLPAMQQFADKPREAAASLAELDASLPANLSPDDAILTAASRRQYQLLGSRLPTIAASAWLLDPPFAVPRDLNTKFGAASVFLLFPDWCAQCISMSPQFKTAAIAFNGSGAYLYVMLAQADPKPPVQAPAPTPKITVKPTASAAARAARPSAAAGIRPDLPHVEMELAVKPVPAQLLMGTPTLIVPPAMLDTFVATDFPLIIATDYEGVVRYIQIAPDNALVPGGLAEQIVDRITEQWPEPQPK
jgi:hypothetical protein